MDVRSEVVAQFNQIAEEQGKRLAPLSDDLPLYDSGLDSFCFAVVVARLEIAVGVDPFATEEEIEFPITFGDFVAAYQRAAA